MPDEGERDRKERRARARASFRKRLKAPRVPGTGALESFGFDDEDDALSDSRIKSRLELVRAGLDRAIAARPAEKGQLSKVRDDVLAKGDAALRLLRDDDESLHDHPDFPRALEAIIEADGSRPSFLIKNGVPDPSTSPVGEWLPALQQNADRLQKAIACVGRIDVDGKHRGTAFLVQRSLVMTNRHVLQEIASRDPNDVWKFRDNTLVDFGHEFDARDSVSPRALKRVLFAGPQPIDLMGVVDHKKLDIVLIELEPPAPGSPEPEVLAVDLSGSWAATDVTLFAVGYPGSPLPGMVPDAVQDLLFGHRFGFKSLAPGFVIAPESPLEPWTLAHDATTLRGSSGSLIVRMTNETNAAGIHYGGRPEQENWGHVLGRTLDEPGVVLDSREPSSKKTLRECFAELGVTLLG